MEDIQPDSEQTQRLLQQIRRGDRQAFELLLAKLVPLARSAAEPKRVGAS
jgi:hypothetical protein